MIKKNFPVIILLALISFQSEEKLRTGIFIGGEILNPSSRNVTLYQGTNVVEMLDLNSNSRFERKYDSLQNGIYKLEHLPE